MPPTAEGSFGLMSDFPLLNILKGLATLTTKSYFSWISATGMDTMPVTAMNVLTIIQIPGTCWFTKNLSYISFLQDSQFCLQNLPLSFYNLWNILN